FEDPEPAGQDIAHVDGTTGVIVAVDPTATWAVAWGSTRQPTHSRIGSSAGGPEPAARRGAAGIQRFRISLDAHGQTDLRLGVLSVSPADVEAAEPLHGFLRQAPSLIAAKKDRLAAALGHSRL